MGEFVPDRSGVWEFGLASSGQARLFVDDALLVVSSEPDVHYRRGMSEIAATLELEGARGILSWSSSLLTRGAT